jgi:hypothetical protein
MIVRALMVAVHPFSRIAKLLSEDGRRLALTQHTDGFYALELREGVWLACELAPDGRVQRASMCSPPENGATTVSEHEEPFVRDRDARIERALRHAPTLHLVAPPSGVSVVPISSWQVSELAHGGRFAWGFDEQAREGRTSSLLSEFDPATACLRSVSGRQYQLLGDPGIDPDAEYVWRSWLTLRGLTVSDARSVSDEVWQAIRSVSDCQASGK